MQGRKDDREKLITLFQLSNCIPKHNFYRRLKEALDRPGGPAYFPV